MQRSFIFSITVFFSALLMFLVQPMLVNYLLPVYGGSYMTWGVSVFVFQSILLAGYFYAYQVTNLTFAGFVKRHSLVFIIGAFFSITFVFLYMYGDIHEWYEGINPISTPYMRLILEIVLLIGVPFFVLSTTSTIVQSLYHYDYEVLPYKLYSYSNLGSLLGLLAYPFIIEFFIGLETQILIWYFAFILYLVLMFIVIARSYRRNQNKSVNKHKRIAINKHLPVMENLRLIAKWILLSAFTSAVLIAVTNEMTMRISPFPLLWILPLSAYLLSFVIAFSGISKIYIKVCYIVFLISLIFVASFSLSKPLIPYVITMAVYIFALFNIVHHYLYSLKPKPTFLSSYYLFIALGGVCGSSLISLLVPNLFNGLWEFSILLIFSVVLVIYVMHKLNYYVISKTMNIYLFVASFFLLFTMIVVLGRVFIYTKSFTLTRRNFYGVVGVTETKMDEETLLRKYISGSTVHGAEVVGNKPRELGYTYYARELGPELTMNWYSQLREEEGGINIGAIGLGVGTISEFCSEEDNLAYYEINPLSYTIAKENFGYLKNSACYNEVYIGDARIVINKLNLDDNEKLDVLVLDAFSDDSIPRHLLTEEAFSEYLEILKSDGTLVIHVSNVYVDLLPVISGASHHHDVEMISVLYSLDKWNKVSNHASKAEWAYISKNTDFIDYVKDRNPSYKSMYDKEDSVLWTDSKSNILQVIRF